MLFEWLFSEILLWSHHSMYEYRATKHCSESSNILLLLTSSPALMKYGITVAKPIAETGFLLGIKEQKFVGSQAITRVF